MAEWNVEDINSLVFRVKKQIENLQTEEKKIKLNMSKLKSTFEGNAEKQFSAEIDVELKNIEIVIQKLENELSTIKSVKKCMEEYENRAKMHTSNLVNVMK